MSIGFPSMIAGRTLRLLLILLFAAFWPGLALAQQAGNPTNPSTSEQAEQTEAEVRTEAPSDRADGESDAGSAQDAAAGPDDAASGGEDQAQIPALPPTTSGSLSADEKNAASDASDGEADGQSSDTVAQEPAGAEEENETASEETPAPEPSAEVTPATAPAPEEEKPATLTIATWGGAYQESQERAYFKPFDETGEHEVAVVTHDGTLDELRRQVESGSPEWDVVDLSSALLDEACAKGLLIRLPALEQPEDFLPGALRECGIGSVAWSALPIYDIRAFNRRKPTSARDFFDRSRFPGKRSLPKGPRYTLELALLADGVPPAEVYSRLSTPEGVTQAFRMLDKIRGETLWWEKPTEPFEHLREGNAVFALAFNGRAFNAIVGERQPLAMLWSGQIYDMNFWAIVKGTAHEDEARAFLDFATEPERLAEQTKWFPYGPVRTAALQYVGEHAEMPLTMNDYIPTSQANMKSAVAFNPAFWAGAEAALAERFSEWLDGKIDAAGRRLEVAPDEAPVPQRSPISSRTAR